MARTARARKLSRDQGCDLVFRGVLDRSLARETALARPDMPLLDRFFSRLVSLDFFLVFARAPSKIIGSLENGGRGGWAPSPMSAAGENFQDLRYATLYFLARPPKTLARPPRGV